jgi:hypothetical protein
VRAVDLSRVCTRRLQPRPDLRAGFSNLWPSVASQGRKHGTRHDSNPRPTVYKSIVNEAAIAAEEAVRLAKGERARADGTPTAVLSCQPDKYGEAT